MRWLNLWNCLQNEQIIMSELKGFEMIDDKIGRNGTIMIVEDKIKFDKYLQNDDQTLPDSFGVG